MNKQKESASESKFGVTPENLSMRTPYGIIDKKGTWQYLGTEGRGVYYFSNGGLFEVFSTPLSASEVKSRVYEK